MSKFCGFAKRPLGCRKPEATSGSKGSFSFDKGFYICSISLEVGIQFFVCAIYTLYGTTGLLLLLRRRLLLRLLIVPVLLRGA